MFEFSLAFKYLLPRKKQLSVTLISLMSVVVISVVVWLLLVFLSITEGLEQGWLSKLTNLNAPVRVNPTQAYFSSYYYNIDNYSQNSNFHTKSLGQKLFTQRSDPFDPAIDMHVSHLLPTPDRKQDGSLKDPVKSLFHVLNQLKSSFPGLTFQEYEVSGASLRLELARGPKGEGNQHSFLNQVAYVSNFAEKSRFQSSLLIPPTSDDLNNLIQIAGKSNKHSALFSLDNITSHTELTEVIAKPHQWMLSKNLLPRSFHCLAVAYFNEDQTIRNIIIPKNKKEAERLSAYSYAKQGSLSHTEKGIVFEEGGKSIGVEAAPITLSFPLKLKVVSQKLITETSQIVLDVRAEIGKEKIQGKTPFTQMEISGAHFEKESSKEALPWVYQGKDHLQIPESVEEGFGIIVPKNLYESGVRIGDPGYLSYNSLTASSLQEQKIAVFIAGFYDPGFIAIGSKCFLVSDKLSHQLASSASSYAVEKTASNGVLVWLNDLQKTRELQKAIGDGLQKEGISAYFSTTPFFEYEFTKDILQQFQSDRVLFTLVGIIILTVACCNIISLLNLMVNNKKKEMAILQALGASKKSLIFIFSFCGLFLGIISSLIGVLLSYLTLTHIDTVVAFLTWAQGYNPFNQIFYGDALPSTISHSAMVKVLIFTPILALIAGLIPAFKAVRIAPSTTLRSE